MSVDLDALDPEEKPGVGTPVPGGLRRVELADALSQLRGDPAFVAMESSTTRAAIAATPPQTPRARWSTRSRR